MSARSWVGFGVNGCNAGSRGAMEIKSRSSASQPVVWRKKSLLPGKLKKALETKVEFPMTTMAGRGVPSSGAFFGASAAAMGSGPFTSSFSFRLTTRPCMFISAQLFGEVRASGTKSQSFPACSLKVTYRDSGKSTAEVRSCVISCSVNVLTNSAVRSPWANRSCRSTKTPDPRPSPQWASNDSSPVCVSGSAKTRRWPPFST